MKKIGTHRELEAYRKAFDAAMEIFETSKAFPPEETYALTDQIRRSSRSVCADLAEAWRKRRNEKSFVSKLSDSQCAAAETQVWLEFAFKCGYLSRDQANGLYRAYDEVIKLLADMIVNADKWINGYQDRSVGEGPEEYNDLF